MKNRFFFVVIFLTGLALSGCSIQDVDLVKVNDFNLGQEMTPNPRLTVNVTLDNPNKFNIKVKKAKLNLLINAGDAGEITLGEVVTIEKSKQGDYDFILVCDREKIMSAVMASGITIAMTGKATVSLKGWIKGKAFGLGKKIKVDEKKSLSLKDMGIKL